MAIIDLSYFWGELYIAQKSQQQVVESINLYINKYESVILKSMLGDTLYEDLTTNLALPTPDAKWITLRNKLANSTTKVSPIANFVWYWMKRRDVSQATGMGETKPESENGIIVSPALQMTRAWNEMVDLNIEFYNWISLQAVEYGQLPYNIPFWVLKGVPCRFRLNKDIQYPEVYIKINSSNL